MSTARSILERNYSEGKPKVNIKIAIINPNNLRQITIEKNVRIDTGFDAGVHIREAEMSELSTIDMKPFVGTVSLAGDIPATAHYILAYLQQIGDYLLPPPGIEVTLIFQGSGREGLLGIEVLNHWTITFNGPQKSYKIVG
jgi:hypothetical protein